MKNNCFVSQFTWGFLYIDFFYFLPHALFNVSLRIILFSAATRSQNWTNMESTRFLVQALCCLILTAFQTFASDASSLSSSVITRNHRRLKSSTFKSFSSVSLVVCDLQCQRHPRCVSTNFHKTSSLHETGGDCELNVRSAVTPIEGNGELEYVEGAVYTQLWDKKVS